jgi:hypothetical protein
MNTQFCLQVTTRQMGVAKTIYNMLCVVKARIQDQPIDVKHINMFFMDPFTKACHPYL